MDMSGGTGWTRGARDYHLSPSPKSEFLSLSHLTSISSRKIRNCWKKHFRGKMICVGSDGHGQLERETELS